MPAYTDIPTPGEWRSDTPGRFGKGRSATELVKLDAALNEYDALRRRGGKGGVVSTAEWSEALINLFEAVEVYLASKGGSHSRERTAAAKELRRVTLEKLTRIRWQKLKELATGDKPNGKLKPMTPQVWSEMHSPGHARVGHSPEPTYAPDHWQQGVASEEFGPADEKYLFQALRNVRQKLGKFTEGVRYVENEDRWKYLVNFENGQAHQRGAQGSQVLKGHDTLITTSGGDLGTQVYAMDGDGNMYVQPSWHQGAQFNHCSFLAGRPVLCAGNVGITQGGVGYIDNGSGHYRPSRKNLVNCLEKLADVIDLQGLYVRDHAGPYKNAIYAGLEFLNMGGFCQPVGYYTSMSGRYDANAHLFAGKNDLLAFIDAQEQSRNKELLKAQITPILTQLENQKDSRFKNPSVKLRCADAAQRQKLQTALLQRITPKILVKPLVVDDAEMQQFFNQHPEIPESF